MDYEQAGNLLSFIKTHAETIALVGATVFFFGIKGFKWVSKKAEKIKFIKAFNREKEINRVLKHYNQRLLSDYLRVWQFHNGDTSIAKVSFMKVSCTNEVVRPGNTPTIDKNKGLFISGIMPWVEPIIDGNERIIKNVDDEVLDAGTKDFLTRNGARAIFAVPLSKDGMVFGYVSAIFKRKVNMDEMVDPEHNLTMFNDVFRKMFELKGVLEKELNG